MKPMKITDVKIFPTGIGDRYFINIVKIETDAGGLRHR